MSGRADRFTALDSWRGLCALVVALFHFPIVSQLQTFALVKHGWLFVDFFFVLSGFVIAYSNADKLIDRPSVSNYVVRRIGRLWPLHATMLALFVTVALVKKDFSDERHSVDAILTNLLMIHSWGMHTDITWNGPSWSISVEFALYLIFAIVAAVPARIFVWMGLALFGAAILAFVAPHGTYSTYDYGIARGLAGFFVGALISRVRRHSFGTAAEVAVVALVVTFTSIGAMTLAAPLVFGLTVYIFAYSDGALNRLLCAKPFVALGSWSYSLYLTHAAVVAVIWAAASKIGLRAEGGVLVGWTQLQAGAAALAYLAIVVVVGWLGYVIFDKPSQRAVRAMLQRTQAARA